MSKLVRFWRNLLSWIKTRISSPRAMILERKLAAVRHEKQALLTEIADVEAEPDGIRGRDKEQLQAFEQRLGQIESEREAATRQLQTLGHSLTTAITKLESTEAW